jgi:hypothetical protein
MEQDTDSAICCHQMVGNSPEKSGRQDLLFLQLIIKKYQIRPLVEITKTEIILKHSGYISF